eukprot:1160410-Pelagomonas_calceolata.AAC.7
MGEKGWTSTWRPFLFMSCNKSVLLCMSHSAPRASFCACHTVQLKRPSVHVTQCNKHKGCRLGCAVQHALGNALAQYNKQGVHCQASVEQAGGTLLGSTVQRAGGTLLGFTVQRAEGTLLGFTVQQADSM